MDFFNKAFAQVSDLFRSMTPGARITAGLLLTVVVVSLAFLFNRQSASADAYLLGEQGAFTAGEMSSMQAAFGKANLSGYVVEGNRIRIPRGQQAAYLGALADSGALPANFGDYLTEAINKPNFITSRQQQEDMLKVAKQKELALIIRSMQGIESAAVHYDVQKKSGLKFGDRTITASVSVKPRGSLALDEEKVPMIRNLVAGALAGLSPDQITVTDLNGRTYGPNTGVGGDASQDPYLSRMKKYKAEYESMLHNILSYVPGIVVTVNVELDKEMSHLEEKVKVDPKTVPVRINEQSTTLNTQSAGPGGRPGLPAQQRSNSPASVGGASGPKSEEERTQSETQNAVSHDKTITNFAPLTPKVVKFSIGVPSNYYEQIWRERNPVPAGQPPKTPEKAALDQIEVQETANIRKAAEALLPNLDATKSAVPLVTVTTFAHLPTPAITGPSVAEQTVTWLSGSWSTLGMLGLALISLMMLRATVRSLPAAPTPSPAAQAAAASAATDSAEGAAKTESGSAGADDPNKPKSRFKRRLGSGPSLRDELTDLVREDPDVAANILRSWIGNAS